MPSLKIIFTLYLIANPIGNSPGIIALIKDYDFEKQRQIMLRESFFALLIAIFFQYLGRAFLDQLEIRDYTLAISGGLLLLIVAIRMIFTQPTTTNISLQREPIMVPIATPLITGPALLTMIMAYSKQADNNLMITLAIAIAWIGVTITLVAAPYLQKLLGKKGLVALEQLMGLLLALMGVEMTVKGLTKFITACGFS